MVKPFDPLELLARVRALLRREASTTSVLTWENVHLDTVSNEVTCNGESVKLTHKEYCLLELFVLNPKRIFSRSAMLDRLWDFAEPPGEETVSTHIKCLRQKLKVAGAVDLIETVYGLGYRLRTPAQTVEPSRFSLHGEATGSQTSNGCDNNFHSLEQVSGQDFGTGQGHRDGCTSLDERSTQPSRSTTGPAGSA